VSVKPRRKSPLRTRVISDQVNQRNPRDRRNPRNLINPNSKFSTRSRNYVGTKAEKSANLETSPLQQPTKIPTMALKAFHDNPCIGGFGGESTIAVRLLDPDNEDEEFPESGDVLCQIVKELVDNAVDACKCKGSNERVKVEILPYEHDDKILKIQVSDNGVGMASIQECVDVFQSSKGRSESKTAGRYGVGLTLCVLHAQRLVSNSYCCITSATEDKEHYTRAFYVVDTNGNSVVCQKEEEFPKPSENESGTCVSVLVPVSTTAF
jgi:anti-sigma regulatory factor (Ser/Thr protein kinase)